MFAIWQQAVKCQVDPIHIEKKKKKLLSVTQYLQM